MNATERPIVDRATRIALRPLRRYEVRMLWLALERDIERLEDETSDDLAEKRKRLSVELRNLLFPPRVVLA